MFQLHCAAFILLSRLSYFSLFRIYMIILKWIPETSFSMWAALHWPWKVVSNKGLLLTPCITFGLYNSMEFLDRVSNYQLCCSVTSVYWLINLVKTFSIGREIEIFLVDLFSLRSLRIVSHCTDDTQRSPCSRAESCVRSLPSTVYSSLFLLRDYDQFVLLAKSEILFVRLTLLSSTKYTCYHYFIFFVCVFCVKYKYIYIFTFRTIRNVFLAR